MSFARGLYAILDLDRLTGRPLSPLAAALLRGGAVAVQVRAKRAGGGALLAAARELVPMCDHAGRPLVVNDRPDVARLAGAWGVHLGQGDLDVADARQAAPGVRVGVSTHSPVELDRAIAAGADYVGYGPVFGTATKENPDPVQGLSALAEAARRSPVPVVAIGGIDAIRVADVARAGAWAAAAIAAIDSANDPEAVARAFQRAFAEAAS
jgi:thiamine-phosphate pyrophosphorylase